MCFDTTLYTKKRIAKEDMIVFKRGRRSFDDVTTERFHSICQHFSYKKGEKQPFVKLIKKKWMYLPDAPDRLITEGYHFYRKEPKYIGMGKMIGVFIVPKGTGYYLNIEEGVAETIIFSHFKLAEKKPHIKRKFL